MESEMNEATIQSLQKDFVQVASLSGVDVSKDNLIYEIMGVPHEQPSKLPEGRVAIYVFCYKKNCLKVGKAGPKTIQRFTSQHYNPGSAPSTLAASLIKGQNIIGLNFLTEENVNNWIKTNTYRFNYLLNKTTNRFTLNLFEAFLQARLNPVFEGSGMKN